MSNALNKPTPLINLAALAVVVVSLVAVMAIMGVFPFANPDKAEQMSGSMDSLSRQIAASCVQCGTVESVRAIDVDSEASGQLVGPAGLTSAPSSAYGNVATEKNARKRTSYRVTVRMDDGTARTLYQSAPPGFTVGSKVKVINGQLSARG